MAWPTPKRRLCISEKTRRTPQAAGSAYAASDASVP